MDVKNLGSGQLAQQAKPDALTDDQGAALKHTADSHTGNPTSVNGHNSVDMNMEAAISADDVMRAGGFGAKDDIGSLLPTAMDSTDFEASLRDARALGWVTGHRKLTRESSRRRRHRSDPAFLCNFCFRKTKHAIHVSVVFQLLLCFSW